MSKDAEKKLGRKTKAALAIAMVAAMTVGSVAGMSAYFTDTDSSTNTFTVGKVKIEHHEDDWDKTPEEEKKEITPNKEFKKDPRIQNTGDNAAYVFQVVEVPCANIITADLNGNRLNGGQKTLTDLFSYTVNNGWTLMKTENVMTGSAVTAHKYTYVYGTAEKCTALEKGTSTPTLFDTVTFCNVVEGEGLEDTVQNIKIDAFAIQTTDLTDADVQAPSQVLGIIYNQAK